MRQTRYEPTLLEASAAEGCRALRQWNILRDVELTGRIDLERLRDALAGAAQLHPLSRARRVVNASGMWTWQVEPDIASMALQTADTTSSDMNPLFQELRAERLLATEPLAFKCIAVRGRSSDRLLFNFCHERTDGIGAMAFLESVRAIYAGEQSQAGSADWMEHRRSLQGPPLSGFTVPGLFQPDPIEHLVGDSGDASDEASHIVNIVLSAADARALVRAGLPGATVTHHLVAAMAIACARWNTCRGSGTGRICIGVPVNARAASFARQGFFNAYGTMCINTEAGERLTLEQATRSVTTQVRHLRPLVQMAGARWAFSTAPAIAPSGPPRAISVLPTATISGLGIWNFGEFGNAGHVTSVWAPPLPVEPMGVSLGVVGLHDKVCLSFRFPRSMVSRRASYEFAHLMLSLLIQQSTAPISRATEARA